MAVRALIVDDEPLVRQSIRRLLKPHTDIEVCGECGDGASAAAAIRSGAPDMVFLDVQMPEMDGLAVVSTVGPERMPATIFITAYEHYALRAFDANAVDYLLKPFGRTRFERALERARDRIQGGANRDAALRILRAMESMAGRTGYVERLPVSENGRIVFVKVKDIRWIEGAGNYARLHTAARSYEIRETLTALERKLDAKEFARIHRSTIVNMSYVKEVHPWFHGYHQVVLEGGQTLRMSRYQREVLDRLGLTAIGGARTDPP